MLSLLARPLGITSASVGRRAYSFSPATERARKPYRLGNALLGGALFAFSAGVYTYSIMAMKQDDFSEVITPPSPPGTSSVKQ